MLFCKPEYSRDCPVSIPKQYTHLEILCFDTVSLFTAVRYFIIYRSPYSDISAVQYMYTLIGCLQLFIVGKHIHVIVGDLNLPKINWETLTCPTNSIHKPFLDYVVVNGFSQFVQFSLMITRSSADADNRLDEFSGQSRSTNMVPFHM